MRTVKRSTLLLNTGKQIKLGLVMEAYAREKQYWLSLLQTRRYRSLIKKHRVIRDEMVKAQYQSVGGLQARMWKLALTDACETMDKYFQSHFDGIKKVIYGKDQWSDVQKHYAYWLLSDYARLFSLLDDLVPEFTAKKRVSDIDIAEAKAVINFIRKRLIILLRTQPKIKKERSFVLDSSCYHLYRDEQSQTQYLSVMGLEAGKRIVLPLKGQQAMTGTIRIVTDDQKNYQVHVGFDLVSQVMPDLANELIALDFGYSEVAVDQHGKRYGDQLGKILTQASDIRSDKGRKRNLLRSVANKAKEKGNNSKAKRIWRNNLGQAKWKAREQDAKGSIEREINTAFNQVNSKQVVTEDLTHLFKSIKNKKLGSKVSYRLSSWVKGRLRKRIEFKALVKGFDHKTVNAAYTSQTCSKCGCVHQNNRKGDKFKCTHCAFEGQADQVAAMNLAERVDDREITRYMPHGVVKQILVSRFQRSVERSRRMEQSNPTATDCNEQDTRHGTEKALTSVARRKTKVVSPIRPSVSERLTPNNTSLVDVGRD